MDKADEVYRAGSDIFVDRLYDEPPEFQCAVVVDGVRFRVDVALVTCGYERRRPDEVAPEWRGRSTTRTWSANKTDFAIDRAAVLGAGDDLVAGSANTLPGTILETSDNRLPPVFPCPTETPNP